MCNAIKALLTKLSEGVRHLLNRNYDSHLRRKDVDGLRGIAVIGVIVFHAFPTLLKGGFVGVSVFFVISGFVITQGLVASLQTNTFSFNSFYSRRAKRIFPALIVTLICCYALGCWILFPQELLSLEKYILGALSFLSNWVAWKEVGYFDKLAELKPLLHLYTLAIEEQFYIVIPVMYYCLKKLRLNFLWVLCVVAILSFLANVGLIKHHSAFVFYSPFTRIWELLIGCVLAVLPNLSLSNHLVNRLNHVISTVGFLLIVLTMLFLDENMGYPGWFALLPTIGTLLIIYAGENAWVNKKILSYDGLLIIGLISYSLYLVHWPLISFATILGFTSSLTMSLLVGLSFILAFLSYRYVEVPGRNLKPVYLYLAMIIIFAYILYAAHKEEVAIHNGLAQRKTSDLILYQETRESDDSCSNLLGLSVAEGVVCLTHSKHPEYLILGDSHAMALNSSVKLQLNNLNTLLFSDHGCIPVSGYTVHVENGDLSSPACVAATRAAIEAAKDISSVKTVFLVSRARSFEPSSQWNKSYIFYDGAGEKVDSEQAYVDGYTNTIKQFEALGKKVVFVMGVPELTFDPGLCVKRTFWLKKVKEDCSENIIQVKQRRQEYLRLIKQIRAKNPGVIFLDSSDFFCDEKLCYGAKDDRIYYSDDNHLSASGSSKFLKWLVLRLKENQY